MSITCILFSTFPLHLATIIIVRALSRIFSFLSSNCIYTEVHVDLNIADYCTHVGFVPSGVLWSLEKHTVNTFACM